MDYETVEEIKRHFNVVGEGLRADIRVAMEGSGNTERLDRVEGGSSGVEAGSSGVESELGGVKAMIRPLIARSDA